jgi:SAM-dependent methyltransferase
VARCRLVFQVNDMKTLSNTFITETLKGKSLGRILVNLCVADKIIQGKTVDIGSKKDASYYRFMRADTAEIITIDIDAACKPDIVLDIEKDPIPLASSSCDNVFVFNVLEHLSACDNALAEAYRILSPGGVVLGCVPFLVNVHADPHDYARYTSEKLKQMFEHAGFTACVIKTLGYGPFSAAYGHIEFMLHSMVKLCLFPLVYSLDKTIQKIKPHINFIERFPIGYYFELRK